MISNEERREIAARLRTLAHDNQGSLGALRMQYVVEAGTRILGTVGLPDCAHVFMRYADLIDPTCHLVGTTSQDWSDGTKTYYHELSCGHTCRTDWPEPPRHCDECGARVVTDDE